VHFIQGATDVRVQATPIEWEALCRILTIDDPDKFKSRAYQEGRWDGVHRYYDAGNRSFPSGLLPLIEERLDDLHYPYTSSHDIPTLTRPIPPDLLHGITLRDYQLAAIERMLARGRGVVRSPPRSGKSAYAAALIKLLDVPSLLVVDRLRLLNQHFKTFSAWGVPDLCTIGDGVREVKGRHVIATVQTLYGALGRREEWACELVGSRELLIFDEVHHLSSDSWLATARACAAPWRFGLSGTPFHDRGTRMKPIDLYMVGATGPLIYDISSSYLRDKGFLANPKLYMAKITQPKFSGDHFPTVYRLGIVVNRARNKIIVDAACRLAKEGRHVLLLVSRIEHGESLLKSIHTAGASAAFTWSADTLSTISPLGKLRRSNMDHDGVVESLRTGKIEVLIASQVLDEGIDIPHLDAVILAGGLKSPIKTIQRAFRGMTSHEGKTDTIIIDFDDLTHHYLRNHSRERIQSYLEEEIDVEMDLPARYVA